MIEWKGLVKKARGTAMGTVVRILGAVVISAMLLGSGAPTPLVAGGGVTVTINAPDAVASGSDFTATVDISQVESFDAGNYDVSFNSTVLRLDNVTNGTIGGTTIPVDYWGQVPGEPPGTFRIINNVLGPFSDGSGGANGTGYLALLHFHVLGSPGDSSKISLSNGVLSNKYAQAIPATWVGDDVPIPTGNLISIEVAPTNPSIPAGRTQQFTATGTYDDESTANITDIVYWESSNYTVATIYGGLAYCNTVGTTLITATDYATGKSGNTTLTVTAAELVSIEVTPADTSIALGLTQQFSANGTYTDNSTADITTSATWTSSNHSVATISSSGLATSLAQGTTTISATYAAVSGNTTLTITEAELVSIAVTPADTSIALGLTQPFTATGTYTDTSTVDLTANVTWTSSNTTVATINATSGLVTAGTLDGTTTITANHTATGISGSTMLTVRTAELLSIEVTPADETIALGLTLQFTATGTFKGVEEEEFTGNITATWTSSNTSVASIDTSGLATPVGQGTTTITATSGNVSGSTTLTVGPPELVSIVVTPTDPSIALGLTQQFSANGTYSDGSIVDITSTATWTSSNESVATIDTSGLATSLAEGTTLIKATLDAVSGNTTLTVGPHELLSIAVTPTNPSIALGLTQPFTATGTYTDGPSDKTSTATWTSSNETVATIDTSGIATSLAEGTTLIKATLDSISGNTTLTVGPYELLSIAVTPTNPSIALGLTQQFSANGTYTDSSWADITSTAIWTSSNESVATIDTSGIATSLAEGTTTISATYAAVSGNTTLIVMPSVVEVNSGNTINLIPGDTVTGNSTAGIPVEVKNLPALGAPANGLAAFTFDFTWDKNVIHVDSASASMDAVLAGWSITPGTPDNVNGTLTVAGYTTAYSTDDIILLYLGISAVGNMGDSTSIDVTITNLGDRNAVSIPAISVNATVDIVNLIAETSISEALDQATGSIVVVNVNIDRIKYPSDNSTANITGGIGSYTAMVSSAPGGGIEVLAVNGVAPFDNLTFDNVTGIFSVDNVTSPIQADNTTVAELVLRLNGNCTISYDLTVAFQAIGAAGNPLLNVPEEQSNSFAFMRGDTQKDTDVDIFDALFIAQYIVGQRTLDQIGALNAASVNHDDSGDKLKIFDALFIAQKIVGQKNAYFE